MKLIKYTILIVFIAAFLNTTVNAQYAIQHSVMGIGGQVLSDSSKLSLHGTLGQPAIGLSGNDAQMNNTGFWYLAVDKVTDLGDPYENIPQKFELYQNFPNPFNPFTSIKFSLPTEMRVKLEIFNVLGEKIYTMLDEDKAAGFHIVHLNGVDLASGMYIYTIKAENNFQIRKMLIVK